MHRNNLASGIRSLFSLENNLKVEVFLEAQREAVLQQANKLEHIAQTLLNKPTRSNLKTLAQEVFAIRADVLQALLELLTRLKPALSPEQFSVYQQQIQELLKKPLQTTDTELHTHTLNELSPELVTHQTESKMQPTAPTPKPEKPLSENNPSLDPNLQKNNPEPKEDISEVEPVTHGTR